MTFSLIYARKHHLDEGALVLRYFAEPVADRLVHMADVVGELLEMVKPPLNPMDRRPGGKPQLEC
jgi:hypothetical protein